jgi:Ca2+-transporting ATPase
MTEEWRDGLSDREAAARLAVNGPNAVARPRPRRLVERVGRQIADPLVLLLLAAFVVTLLIGDTTDATIIALVVVANTAIGVGQEVRADRAIASLDALAAPTARVVRAGADVVIPAAQVVPGDLLRLEAGDIVPADLTLTVAERLRFDESALTGESVAVSRGVGEEASAGTVVVVGRAAGVVVRTGARSGLGRVAALVAGTRPGPTPLQRRLAGLSRMLGLVAVVLSGLVLLFGVLAGRPTVEMAITAVSLVVAAVPESLPAVVTLALALGARRMAAHRAIPRRLHAVETLGSVTVVASDKTGTLTEGRMAVQSIIDATGGEHVVTGRGYEPTGQVTGPGGPGAEDSIVELARAALLCSDAALLPPTEDSPQWRAAGDPLEAAVVAFAARAGLSPQVERERWPRLAEQPFDQHTRRMTTVQRAPDGRLLVICKGAPEAVLAPPLVRDVSDETIDAAAELAAAGLRVLAVAALTIDPGTPEVASAEALALAPAGLRFLGLLGVGDPVRKQAPDVARDFDTAGIRLLLITGDHPATAAAIGRQVGIWREGDVVHHGGDGCPDAQRADRTRVFARVPPEQKLDIIAALQQQGHVVAMTGDGVNDAPALRRADIGVGMGGGTEVARQAADLILVDDNLGTITHAVREGRRIYDNIRRFLHYGLAGGAAEIMVMLVGPFLGLAVPLLPAQILWINLLTHGVPGVALGAEPAEPRTMRRPPRPPGESVLGAGLARAVVWTGLLLAATVLAAGMLASHLGRPWQSVVFVTLGLGQLGIAVAVRAKRTPGGERNPALPAAVAVSAALQVAGVLVAPLRTLLGTAPLSATDLLACLLVAALPGAVVALVRRRSSAAVTAAAARSR